MGGRGATSDTGKKSKAGKKFVTIIDANETGRHSFWEQMLLDKLGKYGYSHFIQDEYEVVNESEKAYQIKIPANTMFKDIMGGKDSVQYTGDDWNVWLPKKAIYEGENRQRVDQMRAKAQSGLEYNAKLVDFAKANGLKPRKRMRTETLLKMIKDAGLTAPERK